MTPLSPDHAHQLQNAFARLSAAQERVLDTLSNQHLSKIENLFFFINTNNRHKQLECTMNDNRRQKICQSAHEKLTQAFQKEQEDKTLLLFAYQIFELAQLVANITPGFSHKDILPAFGCQIITNDTGTPQAEYWLRSSTYATETAMLRNECSLTLDELRGIVALVCTAPTAGTGLRWIGTWNRETAFDIRAGEKECALKWAIATVDHGLTHRSGTFSLQKWEPDGHDMLQQFAQEIKDHQASFAVPHTF